ncbi:MAG: aldehyde dehydrogenase family protein, partial [Spirochaetaceae bacterium]|nr:aldehyde dehydrogenase family protein [Spirochaetaceae bacterium]
MKMLISGEWLEATGGQWIDVDNPATGKVIDLVPRGGKRDIDAAVAAALKGFEVNRRIPARDRCTYLQRAGDLLLDNLEELRTLMIRENGKSFQWADFEIKKSAEILTTLGDRAKDPQGSTYPMDAMDGCAGQMAMTYRQPRGVIGGIIPFNFPLEMFAYKVGGALAAGNAIVVKLSEDCPLTCLRAGELLLEAGVPAASFHMVTGLGEETGRPLV